MDCIEPRTPFRPPKNRRGAKGAAQQVEEFLSFFGNDTVGLDSMPSPSERNIQQKQCEEEARMLEHNICEWLSSRGVVKATPEDNKHRFYDSKRRVIGSKVSVALGSEALELSTQGTLSRGKKNSNHQSSLAARRAFGGESLLDLCMVPNFGSQSPKLAKSTSTAEERDRALDRVSRNRPTLGSCFSMGESTLTLVQEN